MKTHDPQLHYIDALESRIDSLESELEDSNRSWQDYLRFWRLRRVELPQFGCACLALGLLVGIAIGASIVLRQEVCVLDCVPVSDLLEKPGNVHE